MPSRDDLLALSLRELDAMVAEVVMGWKRHVTCNDIWIKPDGFAVGNIHIEPYSSDDNAVRLVRNRIEELGLWPQFIWHLESRAIDAPREPETDTITRIQFAAMQLPAKEQCIAAILAVQEKERRE